MKTKSILILLLLITLTVSGVACGETGSSQVTTPSATGCYKTEYYTCEKTREYDCWKTEYYTYNETVPYYTQESLEYSMRDAAGWQTTLDCDVHLSVFVRNTDTQAGYFTVTFYCYYDGYYHTKTQQKWLAAGEESEFELEFPLPGMLGSCQDWSWKNPTVEPDTKEVLAYRTEQRTGTRQVQDTCTETYSDICERQVWDSDCD